ncbi:unnamed protein product [Spirodela intermedia]|uniref:Nop domain-containing protein n=1 Tax=Spirodela intermedia TaxID=51605 RepID=A0A7I8L6P9_SPIIN|nr:unnamed protein product [Spirodela intermedia]
MIIYVAWVAHYKQSYGYQMSCRIDLSYGRFCNRDSLRKSIGPLNSLVLIFSVIGSSSRVEGIRLHFDRFIDSLKPYDLESAQLGLGHSYSCAKVKFNVNRVDNMVIQAIFLLDTLDKHINSFSMRARDWYSWHFPELVKIVNDNYLYAKIAKFAENKSNLADEHMPALAGILGDDDKAKESLKWQRRQDLSPIDLINVKQFAQRVMDLSEYRRKLYDYLVQKMNDMSLKTRGNTPKYGLIFHSSFIGRASTRNKGRLVRYPANKCSIASRIDCFSESSTTVFGQKLREQVEEMLDFYDKGVAPRKNVDVMKAIESASNKEDELLLCNDIISALILRLQIRKKIRWMWMRNSAKKSKKKKSKTENNGAAEPAAEDGPGVASPQPETEKKKKKHKLSEEPESEPASAKTNGSGLESERKKKKKQHEQQQHEDVQPTSEKKKKKKKSKSKDDE